MDTTHRRYGGCNKQVRAKPYKSQSAEVPCAGVLPHLYEQRARG